MDDRGHVDNAPLEPPPPDQANPWERHTVEGWRAAHQGKRSAAAVNWLMALKFATKFAMDDPRRAAAFHNAGVALLIARRHECALRSFLTARDQWEAVATWIEGIEIPLSGRGSTFHFRLATQHGDAFTQALRQRYITMCHGAAAITSILLRLAELCTPDISSSLVSLERHRSAVAAAFGESCLESQFLRLIFDPTLSLQCTCNLSLFDRWCREGVRARDQLCDLRAAVHLTAGLHPDHLPWSEWPCGHRDGN